MFSEDVHHDRKSEDMAPHHQHEKDELGHAQCTPSDLSHQKITSISHAVHLNMAAFELSNGIRSIGRDCPNPKDG
jgi:hypothetical protein